MELAIITFTVDRVPTVVKLDQMCWQCKSNTPFPDPECPTCHGVGFVLTETGEAVIALMKRHLKLKLSVSL